MSAPVRIQLSRAKGWRMPPGTVKVDRTTPFGNPWRVVNERNWGNGWVVLDPDWIPRPLRHYCDGPAHAARLSVALYRQWMMGPFGPDISSLAGNSLACWCKPGAPCHADVLLEIANRPQQETPDHV